MIFTVCPKCRHAPLPADQAFPAACPGCGVILAKIQQPSIAPAQAADALELDTGSDCLSSKAARILFPVPPQVDTIYWYGRIAWLAVLFAWTYFIWRDMDIASGDSGSWFLHIVLTPFHEAGHYLIFRWFGRFIMTLGGTLGQHLFPIVLMVALLWKRRDAFGAAVFLWLLGYSVADMGVYMYDALDPQLVLLDGRTEAESDGHDWQNIFGDLGLLRQAPGIGLFFGWVGRAVMVAGLAWAGAMVWLQRGRLSDSPFAEEDDR